MTTTHIAPLGNRSLLRLQGADCKEFLQNLVSNDLNLLSPGQVIYAALLTPQGKFLHDFFIVQWQDAVYLDCLTERASDLIRRLTMYKLRADVTIEDVSSDHQLSAIWGDAPDNFPTAIGMAQAGTDYILYADPRLDHLGYRCIETKDSKFLSNLSGTASHPLTDYTAHRLSLGVPEGGTDLIPEKNFLLEGNMEELNCVSFSKGCYVGQELTARTKYRAKIKKRLFRFTYEGDIAIGDSITLEDTEIATVVAFQAPYGLAFTRLKDWHNMEGTAAALSPKGLVLYKPDYVKLPEDAQ